MPENHKWNSFPFAFSLRHYFTNYIVSFKIWVKRSMTLLDMINITNLIWSCLKIVQNIYLFPGWILNMIFQYWPHFLLKLNCVSCQMSCQTLYKYIFYWHKKYNYDAKIFSTNLHSYVKPSQHFVKSTEKYEYEIQGEYFERVCF